MKIIDTESYYFDYTGKLPCCEKIKQEWIDKLMEIVRQQKTKIIMIDSRSSFK